MPAEAPWDGAFLKSPATALGIVHCSGALAKGGRLANTRIFSGDPLRIVDAIALYRFRTELQWSSNF